MAKSYESIRIFQNPILEKFTHVHPLTPLIFWSPIITYLFWRGYSLAGLGASVVVGLGLAGLLIWTPTEYVLHRFIFHFRPTTPLQEKLQFLIHGLHHADPMDATRLVMPPVAGAVIATVLYFIFRVPLGGQMVDPFFAGFLIGYLIYDYTHFAVHFFRPRTRLGKFIKQNHMIHHFVNHDSRWGVSSPFWDYVFGTTGESKNRVRHGS
jgi:sterol desaturase/sphingolipid hydroxylase (fatty acid hydroxylase superfamily)